VSVRKVTPANTHQVDGFRYYLPRPYLALKVPMPVAGDEFVVSATLGPDGAVSIPRASLPAHLQYHFREGVEASAVSVPQSELSDGALADGFVRAAEAVKPATGATMGSAGADSGPQGTTVALAEGTMSIVYLPDFDEQYAIKYRAGLGRVDTGSEGLRLRHGWMLDNVSLTIDNVELGKFIFGQVDKFTDLVSLIGARKNKVLEEFSGTLKAAADDAAVKGGFRNVRLRITYAIVAQPGVYPLLKPCERGCECAPVSGMPGSVSSPVTDARNWVLVPYQPFTSIAYNVKRAVSVELLPLETAPKPAPSPSVAPAPTNDAAIVRWLRSKLPDLADYPDGRFRVTRAETSTGGFHVVQVTGASQEQIARWSGLLATERFPMVIGNETVTRLTLAPGT
jgi:hypothetical protein